MHPITASLDRALVTEGEVITIRRRIGTGPTFVEVMTRAKVAGFNSEVLVSGVKQTASTLVISPTPIQAAIDAGTWPGAAAGPLWPRVGDFIRQGIGADRSIQATLPVIVAGQVVRVEAKVLG